MPQLAFGMGPDQISAGNPGGSGPCRKLTEIGHFVALPESATAIPLDRGEHADTVVAGKEVAAALSRETDDRGSPPGSDLVHRDCIASADVWRDFGEVAAAEAWQLGFARGPAKSSGQQREAMRCRPVAATSPATTIVWLTSSGKSPARPTAPEPTPQSLSALSHSKVRLRSKLLASSAFLKICCPRPLVRQEMIDLAWQRDAPANKNPGAPLRRSGLRCLLSRLT